MTPKTSLSDYIDAQLQSGKLSYDGLMKLRSTDFVNHPSFMEMDQRSLTDELTAIQGKYASHFVADQINGYIDNQPDIKSEDVRELYQREVKNSIFFFPKHSSR